MKPILSLEEWKDLGKMLQVAVARGLQKTSVEKCQDLGEEIT
jgi:hypothetical protein